MFYYSITNTKEESKHLLQGLKAEEKNLKLISSILLLKPPPTTSTKQWHPSEPSCTSAFHLFILHPLTKLTSWNTNSVFPFLHQQQKENDKTRVMNPTVGENKPHWAASDGECATGYKPQCAPMYSTLYDQVT